MDGPRLRSCMVVLAVGLCGGCTFLSKDTHLSSDGKRQIREIWLFGRLDDRITPGNPKGLLPLWRSTKPAGGSQGAAGGTARDGTAPSD